MIIKHKTKTADKLVKYLLERSLNYMDAPIESDKWRLLILLKTGQAVKGVLV